MHVYILRPKVYQVFYIREQILFNPYNATIFGILQLSTLRFTKFSDCSKVKQLVGDTATLFTNLAALLEGTVT